MEVASSLITLQRITEKTDGRDKFLKVIQYVSRVWILQQTGKTDVMKRLEHLISAFSTTRKVIRLGHAVEPFSTWHGLVQTLDKPGKYHALGILSAALGVVNDCSDDIICLSKLQVIDKHHRVRWEPISARLWFTCISIDLYTTYMEYKELENQLKDDIAMGRRVEAKQEKHYWLQVTLIKLLADALFCSVDLNSKAYIEPDQVQAWSGMISGILSFYKLWSKHKVR
jgi:hypothetical protein